MVLWFNDPEEWNKLEHWKTVDGQEGFEDAVPCRELEDYLNEDNDVDDESEQDTLPLERLFLIAIVKSKENVKLSLTPWINQRNQKKKSRKETLGGSGEQNYYRMHTAINLLSKRGEMFFITEKNRDSDLLWGLGSREFQRKCIFGLPYIMAVSQNVGSYMSGGEVVVEPNYSIRELADPLVPAISWQPKTAESFPFILHAAKIRLESFVLVKSVCNGIFCDRRSKSNESNTCACYVTSSHRGSPAVSLRVMLRLSMNSTATERINWTSYGFLRWLIDGGKVTGDFEVDNYQLKRKLTKVCQKMTKYTNDNGGFLVVGWGMQGLSSDHNTSGEEKVVSDHYTLHLARVEPMNRSEQFKKDLKEMQFKV